jgi:F-type H+-transporting ATPase subunit b
MELITPGIGLLFWMVLCFGILLFIMRKFAWHPLLTSIREREKTINDSLQAAETAKKEMENIQAGNAKIIAEAKEERSKMIKEGERIKDKLVSDAKIEAKKEADYMIQRAKEAIKNEKAAAVNDMKTQITNLSIDIAEKILRKKLEDDKSQKEYINTLLKDIKLN